ncbi:MAG: Cof-type HAD-IIB family hydrolase [Solobacterium sp.]|nr:Cof-type HAD-IIB family hydrolase [Solobacterium sp.]
METEENEIKLIACDVDNTIITPGTDRISKRLKECFHKAIEKDILVFVNTGRHYTFLQPSLFDDLPMECIGTINGGCLVDREGNVLAKHPMSLETMNHIIEFSREYDIGLGFKFEDAVVTYHNYDKFIEGYTKGKERETKLVINDDETKTHHLTYGLPLGVFFVCDEDSLFPHVNEIPEISIAWSHRDGFDAFLKNVNKAAVIEEVLERKGWTWDNVIGFGDAENDIPFIQKAKIGVVVGNAKDNVKAYADYVTDTCPNDGVAKALEELHII